MTSHIIKEKQFNERLINGEQITDVITQLAKSKAKDYKSLSNKAIFKLMDLVDM
jgi:hypothetical protein